MIQWNKDIHYGLKEKKTLLDLELLEKKQKYTNIDFKQSKKNTGFS